MHTTRPTVAHLNSTTTMNIRIKLQTLDLGKYNVQVWKKSKQNTIWISNESSRAATIQNLIK